MEFGVAVLPWQWFIMEFAMLPFYLAIGDKLFGASRIAHRIGGLFVVCGCSILASGYVTVSYIVRFRIMYRGII